MATTPGSPNKDGRIGAAILPQSSLTENQQFRQRIKIG
jgi:hypothetical protein